MVWTCNQKIYRKFQTQIVSRKGKNASGKTHEYEAGWEKLKRARQGKLTLYHYSGVTASSGGSAKELLRRWAGDLKKWDKKVSEFDEKKQTEKMSIGRASELLNDTCQANLCKILNRSKKYVSLVSPLNTLPFLTKFPNS